VTRAFSLPDSGGRISGPVIQCAINFSEGRRPEVIEAIAGAARSAPGAILADCSADPDHNRMVATILGGAEAIAEAALASVQAAIERIDLRRHSGQHPRLGAVDVIPLVPIRGVTREECVETARRIGQELAARFALPVYFYEYNAAPGHRALLPQIRKGGFEGLFGEPLTGERAPDLGPNAPHPTAGAVVLGTRDPLIACNIELDTPDLQIARRIAARIRRDRETIPALAGVRALGLFLASRNRAQVSMNLTRVRETSLPAVFRYVEQEAARFAVKLFACEIIGLIPMAALDGASPEEILWRDARETQFLEYWL
jgi:glutamate formiminotransferase